MPIIISIILLLFGVLITSVFDMDKTLPEDAVTSYLGFSLIMLIYAIFIIGPQSLAYSVFQEFAAIPLSKFYNSRLVYVIMGCLFGFLCGATIDFLSRPDDFQWLGLLTGLSASVILGKCGAFKCITNAS